MKILLDTDVIIEFLKGREGAKRYLLKHSDNISLSVITIAELFAGVRDGRERQLLEAMLYGMNRITIDDKIAELGGLYRRDFKKSHNVGLADALIAATAELNDCKLVTFNTKHFPMLKNVSQPYNRCS